MPTDDQRRVIGKVISVTADRLTIELLHGNHNFTVVGFDDVHYVARLGSFVMIPVQSDYVVAEVVGLREKDAPGATRSSDVDTDLDKTSSAKYLDVVPLGMLPQQRDGAFRFGVSVFPSLYADALYVLDAELDRIFDVDHAEEPAPNDPAGRATRFKALTIGTSIVFDGYDIKVRLDEFFGGHIAVLGNTGSGKSCTVATLLQSVFTKSTEYAAAGASFLVLDVNGEYRQAFAALPQPIRRRYIQMTDLGTTAVPNPHDERETTIRFRLPHWFMSVEEWELLLQASERTQRPVLRTALGLTSLLNSDSEGQQAIRRHFVATCILECFRGADGDSPVSKIQRVASLLDKYSTPGLDRSVLKKYGCNEKFGNFDPPANQRLFLDEVKTHVSDEIKLPGYVNAPFRFDLLEDSLDLALLYEEAHGNRQIRDYCAQMITRFKWIREREEFAFLRVPIELLQSHEKDVTLYVDALLGLSRKEGRYQKSSQVSILDLNEAPDEVVEVAAAVIARLVFERLRTASPRNALPVNIVLEEAHRYIAQVPSRFAIDASKIFERIAKEGRKYGLFLLVASQRPSELSRTVLSQCSNFIIHRIQNPEDLLHIRQMTPFVSEPVLRRLPSLPKQHALIFGNAVNLPTSFKVRDVSPKPRSEDAAIRDLWFRPIDDTLNLDSPTDRRQRR